MAQLGINNADYSTLANIKDSVFMETGIKIPNEKIASWLIQKYNNEAKSHFMNKCQALKGNQK